METIKVNTSQHVAIDYPVAGLGERIAARLIDLGVFLGVYLLFILFFALTIGINGNAFFKIVVFIYLTCYVFYNLAFEIFMNGQSIGKKLMKIKVISIDGGQPSVGQYFIRWLFRLVDFVLTGQVGGLICIALSEKKQRIGDIVAGTTVIKTSPGTSLEHIAFHPEEEDYVPMYVNVHELNDREIELVHEVITTYYKTANYHLVETMATKVANLLSVSLPEKGHQINFLKTVVKDYNHITSSSY